MPLHLCVCVRCGEHFAIFVSVKGRQVISREKYSLSANNELVDLPGFQLRSWPSLFIISRDPSACSIQVRIKLRSPWKLGVHDRLAKACDQMNVNFILVYYDLVCEMCSSSLLRVAWGKRASVILLDGKIFCSYNQGAIILLESKQDKQSLN